MFEHTVVARPTGHLRRASAYLKKVRRLQEEKSKDRELEIRGLAPPDTDALRNGDLARLDMFCFRQGQRHKALFDFCANFVGVD